MIEYLVTSSVLITALICLRAVFRNKISRRLQYALWGLALLRLLLPFPLMKSPLSVMNAARTAPLQAREEKAVPNVPAPEALPSGAGSTQIVPGDESVPGGVQKQGGKSGSGDSAAEYLKRIWFAGSAAGIFWVVSTNLRFYARLRKTRMGYEAPEAGLPVYVSPAIDSPCLFGLPRPAIYLTPRAAQSGETMRMVLEHELCHYRHGDHLWSLMRGLCLAAHWWNPLVWAAAILSRLDAEMACDEAVIRRIGEGGRLEYGRALVDMIAVKKAPSGLMCAATTMVSGKRGIKSRLDMIIKKPKTFVPALVAVIIAAALCVGCTFTSAKTDAGVKSKRLSPEEALDKLISGISFSDSQVSFTIPEDYENPKDWNIHIAGRALSGEFSQSLHFYEDVNDAKAWERGKTYAVALSKDYVELSISAALPSQSGGTIEKSASLLPSISYNIRKLGAAGSVLLPSPEGAKLCEDIIADFMVKSAAWPAADVDALDECYLIEQKYSNGKNIDYYAYKLEGLAYLQHGVGGQRSRLNDELYERFKAYADSRLAGGSAQERFAREYVDKVIESFKSYGVIIKDSKITSLKKAARFENLTAYPIELWLLEYRMLPEDISKVIFAGGMTQENGAITEYGSMGQPLLIISYPNGNPTYLGNTWTGSVNEEGGMENGLRLWLENRKLIKPETYQGDHYNVSFKLSDGREAILILSQPVRKGSGGIWCVERWYDSYGNMYLVTPDLKGEAYKYYLELQAECDSGHRPGLLDPRQAALEYITGTMGQHATFDSIKVSEKYSGLDADVVVWSLLNEICSSPAASSNPGDYIKAHKSSYEALVSGGETTLRYICSEFLKGGQTGLNGHIMRSVMLDILGGEAPDLGTASTGQEWFERWKDWALKNRGELEKNNAKSALLFKVMKSA